MTHYQIVRAMKARRIRGLDIAEMAGVSQATVVRVLSRKDGIREDRREAVWAALEEVLNSPEPNGAAGDPPTGTRAELGKRAATPR